MYDLDTIMGRNANERGGNLSYGATMQLGNLLVEAGMNDSLVERLRAKPDMAEKLALIFVHAAAALTRE